jgi:hypothetical protein
MLLFGAEIKMNTYRSAKSYSGISYAYDLLYDSIGRWMRIIGFALNFFYVTAT